MTRYERAGAAELRRLLDAVMTVGSGLSLPVVLRHIIDTATSMVGARYGALGVLDESRTSLAEFVTVGMSVDDIAAIDHYPKGHGILGLLIVRPEPLRLPDLSRHPDSFGFPPGHPPMSSFLGVPIRLRDTVFGNLYLTDKQTPDGQVTEFTEVDEEMVVALAAAAALAIENARLHEHTRDLALLEERERIARDLHDDVIQRIFAAGLTLQSTSLMTNQPDVAARLAGVIDDLDVAIRQTRQAIFQLHQRGDASVRADIVSACNDATATLGFDPLLQVSGPIDSAVDARVAQHLVAAVREALSNVARHAAATRVEVCVSVERGGVRLEVTDNGRGLVAADVDHRGSHGTPGGGNGLRNLAERADALGGTFSLSPADEGGTRLLWTARLR